MALDLYELIEQLHANTANHYAFVVDCDAWPCHEVGNPHPFRTAPADRHWNEPGQCYLCGEAEPHPNHPKETSVQTTADAPSTHLYKTLNIQWHPREDRVLVLPLLAATASVDGIIVLPTDSNRERPLHGIVIATGPGGISPETGRAIPMRATVGELVAFGRYAGLDFEVTGPKGLTKVLIMRDCEILLARPENDYELIAHEDDPAKMHEVGYACDLCIPPTVDLEKLKDIAYGGAGDVIDAEVPDEPLKAAEPDPAREAAAKASIESERERLRQQREAQG